MPAGRPSRYSAEFAELARKACLAFGSTDEELAKFFEVSVATISNWKLTHPEFLEAIKKGKKVADVDVIHSLYRRATGYSHPAVKIYADVNTGEEKIVPYTEHYPPDTTACIFWLKNRQREHWRDKQPDEINGVEDGLKELAAAIRDSPHE